MKEIVPFTGLMLTHERHEYLKRIFDYYSDADFKIRVYDSSLNYYQSEIPQSIIYNHCPAESFWSRFYQAIHSVDTDFWGYASDDDFISKCGVRYGIDYLSNHADYSSVQGKCIGYLKKDNDLLLKMQNAFSYLMDVSSDISHERVKQAFFPYKEMGYAVFRKEVAYLLQGFNFEKMPSYNFGEFWFSAISSIVGKHKILSYMGIVKEFIPSGLVTLDKMLSSEDQKDGVQYLINLIAKKWHVYEPSITIDQASKIIMDSFNIYAFKHIHFRQMLARSGYNTPEVIVYYDEYKKVLFEKLWDGYSKKAIEIRDNTFPVFDNNSKNELHSILDYIIKNPCRLA